MTIASRTSSLNSLRGGGPLDVLVIGGGIVGSGVARDAALRGLKTALVDQFDFAFGTSSRSSRLLHGGLRYLAQGRVGLVHEASVEKVTISHIAPHLAAPLPFIFPTRRGTEWKRWKLSIGVKAYDWLCGTQKNLGKSQTLSAEQTLKILPQLNPDRLTGAVRYFDAMTNDARLVLDTLRSAASSGATLVNYCPVTQTRREGDLWRCGLADASSDGGDSFELAARCVVNATGAWADRFPASGVKLRLTKGVHLVIDRQRLNVPDAVVMAEGSRILFAIPWGERVILGTTDTDYDGPPETPTCEEADLRYILDVTNATFPSVRLTPADVISTWVGLRPLISKGGESGHGKPSDISRAHQIDMTEPGWIDVAGGKLTTYRLMAEQTVDRAIEFLNLPLAPPACRTATTPLLDDRSPRPAYSGILPPDVSREAVEHYVRHEWAMHLVDVMIRRTSWRYYHRDHSAIARQVATWMRELLGWSDDRTAEELKLYETTIAQATCGLAPPAPTRSAAAQVQPA